MKNFLNKFKYLLIGLGLALSTTVYAINVTVPQSTGLGDILRGNANGTYTPYATGSEGTVLKVVSGVPTWSTDLTGGSGSVANGIAGYVTRYTGTSTITTGILLDNATVAGVNATSSTSSFNIQGTAALNPLRVASSTGTALLTIAPNGSTTIASLGTGPIYGSSGSLYTNGTTGTGLTVQATSPTLVTPILGVASGTALTLSNNLWVSGTLSVTGTSTLATTSIPALSNLTSNGFVKTSGGLGTLSIDTSTYLTGNQTITLSGDVSGSGTTGITTTIGNDKVTEAMLKVVDTPNDEEILTYETTTGDFEWQTPAQTNIPNYAYASSAYATLWNLTAGSNITITTTTNPTIAVSLTPTFTTLSTGQGQYELYAMDQDVLTSSNVTFAKGTFTNASTSNLTVTGNTYFTGLASQNCLGTSASGLLQAGTCTGGSGNSAWTMGNALIYNATSTDSVLVGTTTPTTAKLFVQGSGSQLPLRVASSTGATLFTIDTFGSTTIANLTAAGCDVKSTTGGSLYCGTDATGASTGNAAWTIGSGLIYNATSTDLIGIGTITPTTTLFVQGKGGTNPFALASSSGSQMLALSQRGQLMINTTTVSDIHTYINVAGPSSGGVGPKIDVFDTTYPQGGSFSMENFVGTGEFQMNGTIVAAFDYTQNETTIQTPHLSQQSYINMSKSYITLEAYNQPARFRVGGGNFAALTGGALFGIGTSVPGSFLTVVGTAASSTLPLVTIASSTGSSLLTVSPNGSTTLSSLASAGCVAATATGSLYITSCGGGSGNSAWTIGNGLIYNATSTDEVGIGTATPSSTLHIQGNGSTNIFTISSSTGTTLLNVNPRGTLSLLSELDIRNATAGSGILLHETNNDYLQFQAFGYQFRDFQANIMVAINSDGTVGIGSSSPYSTLVVKGTSTAPTIPILTIASSSGSSFLQVNANGNIGISTTTPAYKLTVVGTAGNNPVLNVASSTGVSMLHVGANGKVGIGTTTPQGMLDILDTSSNTQPSILYVGGTTTPSTTKLGCIALYDNSAKLYVYMKFVSGAFTTSTTASICQ